MKKALQITLAGSLFTIEEDAYDKLNAYLNSIKDYFSHITDSDDVVEDIEARMAEQLLEKIKHHNNIVTILDVQHVMESMGTIEEISGTSAETTTKQESGEEPTQTKRLYRSSDDVVIAGVASGIASFFEVDAFAMRIVFVIALFVTGGGFAFAYIVGALLIPQAKTLTDKVKMKGGPVTLQSFKENFNEQMKQVKENSKEIIKPGSNLRNGIEKAFNVLGNLIRVLVNIIVKITAFFLIAGAAFAAMVQIFIAGNLLFNYNSPYIDFPVAQVVSQPIFIVLVLIAFLIVFIPTFFVGSLGAMIVAGKSKVSSSAAIILGGIWLMAVIFAGTLGVRTGLDMGQKIKSLPEYQKSSQVFDVTPFTKLNLQGGDKITFTQGEVYSVTVNGRQIDIDNTIVLVENGVLGINDKPQNDFCFICVGGERMNIEITAPNIDSIIVNDGVDFKAENITGTNITISVEDSGFADINLIADSTTVEMKDAAHLILNGTSSEFSLVAKDAIRFDGDELVTTNATITLTDAARAHIEATGKLQIRAADGSRATYVGTNALVNIEDGAQVENVSSSTKRAVEFN